MKQKGHVWAAACAALLCMAFAALTSAESPSWWTSQGVLNTNWPANDFAPVLAGQLKWMATNAAAELETLPGGAGTGVHGLVSGFTPSNNYVPINLGQLKNTAAPFYQRLMQVGYATNYPWTETTADDADFAPALLGQLKHVFDFDVSTDTDEDGLPDWWEVMYWGSVEEQSAAGDPDGDDLANLGEYLTGTSPVDADTDGDGLVDNLDGHVSTNDYQIGADMDADGYTDGEMDYGTSPTNYDTDTDGLVDALDGRVSTAAYAAGADADQDGYVDGEMDFGASPTNSDSDADGMPDGWEVRYGLRPVFSGDSGDDPDGDEVANLQEYQSGTDPNVLDSDGDSVADGLDTNPSFALDSEPDGLPDDWEMFWFGNLYQMGTDNPDGDGYSNTEEFSLGTDPTKANQDDSANSDLLTVYLPIKRVRQ